MLVIEDVGDGDGGKGERRWMRVGDGCVRMVMDEVDGVVDGGNRLVVAMGNCDRRF